MRRAVVILGFIAFVVPTSAHADSFGIQVLSATCSTTVEFWRLASATTTTGCGTSQSVISLVPDEDGGIRDGRASASADIFDISTTSSSYFHAGNIVARADSLLTFAPLTDGTAILGLDYLLGFYGAMYISLYDLSLQELIFEQAWGHSTILNQLILEQGYGNAAANTLGDLDPDGFIDRVGSLDAPTTFSADHTYVLRIHTDGNSNNDATLANLRVSGLVPVPEPSSLLLLGAGLAGIGVLRRSRTHTPS